MTRLLGVFLCFLSASCQYLPKKKGSFRIVEVARRDLVKFVEANGSVEAFSTVDVYSPVPGRLEKIFVKEGDLVRAKQKIGFVSSDSRSLFLDMAATKSQKELEYWKNQLQLTPIMAPASGKIISLKANLDDRVSGAIAQISQGEVIRANVDEADLPSVKIGQNVDIRFDIAPEKPLQGNLTKIAQVSRLVNNVNVYECEVSLPPADQRKFLEFEILIGMSVTLSFPVAEKKQVVALAAEIAQGKSNAKITLTMENDQKRKVKLGDMYGDWVEVISGLEPGEKFKVSSFKLQAQKTRRSPLIRKD